MVRRAGGRAAAAALATISGVSALACGSSDSADDGAAGARAAASDPAAIMAYDEVAEAVEESMAPTCPPGEFRPAPEVSGSAAAAHFDYLDGRIYELGPCELPIEQRGELRVYRYADTATRDAAAESSLDRNPRPTFMWISGERLLVEEWLFDRAEADPAFDEVAGQVHDAVSAMPETEGVS